MTEALPKEGLRAEALHPAIVLSFKERTVISVLRLRRGPGD